MVPVSIRTPRKVRSLAKALLPARVRSRIRRAEPPWVISVQQQGDRQPLQRFGFYAVVGTWMEADIIADTVANAFAQGVDRVFVVDNDSPDDTVARATGAGAEHVLTYQTRSFEEKYRYRLMNEFVRHASITSEFDHVWWLWLDADEFARPAQGGTLRAMLGNLDAQYRVVGARFVNHYPVPGKPAHVAGDHPIDHQPLCEELPLAMCDALHRKHPLQRWDRFAPFIEAGLGFHGATCAQRPLLEPIESAVIHHFPFRNESATRRRIDALWNDARASDSRAKHGDLATDHMEARMRSLDAVYHGDWAQVHNFMPGAAPLGVDLVDWRSLDPPLSPHIVRWGPQR